MTQTTDPGRDDARPDDEALRMYVRAYRQQIEADDLYLRWEAHTAHAMLLEQDPGREYPEYGGLTGRQLGEGARIAARRMALLVGERPAFAQPLLGLKVAIHEAMVLGEDELRRSHTAVMIEAAIQRDAKMLGIALTTIPVVPGTSSRH